MFSHTLKLCKTDISIRLYFNRQLFFSAYLSFLSYNSYQQPTMAWIVFIAGLSRFTLHAPPHSSIPQMMIFMDFKCPAFGFGCVWPSEEGELRERYQGIYSLAPSSKLEVTTDLPHSSTQDHNFFPMTLPIKRPLCILGLAMLLTCCKSYDSILFLFMNLSTLL